MRFFTGSRPPIWSRPIENFVGVEGSFPWRPSQVHIAASHLLLQLWHVQDAQCDTDTRRFASHGDNEMFDQGRLHVIRAGDGYR